jgi:hypothetical protein
MTGLSYHTLASHDTANIILAMAEGGRKPARRSSVRGAVAAFGSIG